ncbi:MAG: hypothetical protein EXS43_14000 [Opitutus sp.]|nr:hypothetical protein [Opitutus sp.]
MSAHDTRWGIAGGAVFAAARVGGSALLTRDAAAGGAWRAAQAEPLGGEVDFVVSGKEGTVWFFRPEPGAAAAAAWLRPDPNGKFIRANLPALPDGFQAVAGATQRETLYVAAADARQVARLFRIPLRANPTATAWTELGEIDPAIGRVGALAVQSDGERPRVYVFDAVNGAVASYEFSRRVWERHRALRETVGVFLVVPAGVTHVMVGVRLPQGVEQLRAFNTTTGAWSDPLPWELTGALAAAVADGPRILALTVGAGGDVRLVTLTATARTGGLHVLDYTVFALFFATLFAIAWTHKTKSSDRYFRGGRRVPWLAAGLSVVATRLSATSFISIPAKSFATNWQYSFVPLTNVVGAFIMSRYFVKFFVRLNVTSGYEYLEKRFSPLVRTLGSLNYLLYELSRIGVLILVPAIALYAVAKFDLPLTIGVIGLIVTLYTMLGGLEGIVWADVFQMLVKIGGLLVALVFVFGHLAGNFSSSLAEAWHDGKLRVVDLSWDFTRDTLWVFILFWITDGLKSYVANQTIIQRFISTKDEAAAQRTIWSSALIGTAVSWLFLLLGTGLFLFYREHPGRLDLTMDKPDAVFPWYIVFELPVGVTGFLIVALIAAAMSSLAGALNSTSTVIVTDFYRRFARAPNDATAVRLGKILTAAIGIFATGLALVLSQLSNKSLFDQTLSIVGLFGGGLGGLFLLGMLTTRTSAAGALAGLLGSVAVQYFVGRHTSLHLLTYMFTGMSSCMALGYAWSWFAPERKDLTGLTVHTTPDIL